MFYDPSTDDDCGLQIKVFGDEDDVEKFQKPGTKFQQKVD